MKSGTKRWLSSTVTIAPRTGMDGYGQDTYGVAVSYDALIVHKSVRVFGADGVETVSSAQVYLDEDAVVASTSKITLPDSTTPRILAVETRNNITDGTAYMKVVYT